MIDSREESMVDAHSTSLLDSNSHTISASLNEGAQVTDDVDNENQVAVPSDESNNDVSAKPSPRNVHGFAWALVVASILMANFLFATDNTIAANIQPAVVNDFHSLDKLAWLPVAFLASSWGTNLLWGGVYVRFSSIWTFCSSFIIFAVGSAVCGAAPSMDALIVGRAICGLGGAGMYFGSMALLTQMTSERERPLYLNLVGITFGGGTVLGPIIGGAFAVSSATWRWGFYFNLVVGAVCAPVYLFLLPVLNPRPGQTIMGRAREIDYIGVILLCGLIVSIVMAISFGGVEYAWNSGQVIALFVVSFVLFCAFFVQQIFSIETEATHRIFPLHFFKSTAMIVLFLEIACAATCVFVPVYFLPLYFQFVRADSAILAGVRMLPFVAFQIAIAILTGWLAGKTGYFVPWYLLAGITCLPGAALLYTVDQNTPLANVYGYEILIGLGSGASTQLNFAVASIMVDPIDIPLSTGWIAFAQLGGPTIVISIANSVFLNKAHIGLKELLPNMSTTDISTIISDPGSPLLRGLPQSEQSQVVHTVVRSMSDAYILCIIGGSLVLLLIFRFKVNSKLYG